MNGLQTACLHSGRGSRGRRDCIPQICSTALASTVLLSGIGQRAETRALVGTIAIIVQSRSNQCVNEAVECSVTRGSHLEYVRCEKVENDQLAFQIQEKCASLFHVDTPCCASLRCLTVVSYDRARFQLIIGCPFAN